MVPLRYLVVPAPVVNHAPHPRVQSQPASIHTCIQDSEPHPHLSSLQEDQKHPYSPASLPRSPGTAPQAHARMFLNQPGTARLGLACPWDFFHRTQAQGPVPGRWCSCLRQRSKVELALEAEVEFEPELDPDPASGSDAEHSPPAHRDHQKKQAIQSLDDRLSPGCVDILNQTDSPCPSLRFKTAGA